MSLKLTVLKPPHILPTLESGVCRLDWKQMPNLPPENTHFDAMILSLRVLTRVPKLQVSIRKVNEQGFCANIFTPNLTYVLHSCKAGQIAMETASDSEYILEPMMYLPQGDMGPIIRIPILFVFLCFVLIMFLVFFCHVLPRSLRRLKRRKNDTTVPDNSHWLSEYDLDHHKNAPKPLRHTPSHKARNSAPSRGNVPTSQARQRLRHKTHDEAPQRASPSKTPKNLATLPMVKRASKRVLASLQGLVGTISGTIILVALHKTDVRHKYLIIISGQVISTSGTCIFV